MLTGLKFDLLIGSFFLWRGSLVHVSESQEMVMYVNIFIKPVKRDWRTLRTGLPSLIILHDNSSTTVAFFICILLISLSFLSSFTHEKTEKKIYIS